MKKKKKEKNVSCEIEAFIETHVCACKLCVILCSRVLRGLCGFIVGRIHLLFRGTKHEPAEFRECVCEYLEMEITFQVLHVALSTNRAYQVCHRSAPYSCTSSVLPTLPPSAFIGETSMASKKRSGHAAHKTAAIRYRRINRAKTGRASPEQPPYTYLSITPPQHIERGLFFFQGCLISTAAPPLPSTRCRLPEQLRLLSKHIVNYENATAEFIATLSWRNRRRVGKR